MSDRTIDQVVAGPGQGTEGDDQQLGSRVRQLRRERQLSVQALATRAGLSSGMVSQIERGLSTPSLRSLRLLSTALAVPITWFFETPAAGTNGESTYVVRHASRRQLRLTPSGVRKALLSPDTTGRLMELYELVLQPSGNSGSDFYSHEGEKAGVVLEGSVRLWIEEEVFTLSEGDSFQFPSTVPHRFENPGGKMARMLWINAPPVPRRS